MKQILTRSNGLLFLGGIVAGLLGKKVVQSDTTRRLVVQGVAQGMIWKDETTKTLANLQEEAETLCNEAREMAKRDSDFSADYDGELEIEPIADLF